MILMRWKIPIEKFWWFLDKQNTFQTPKSVILASIPILYINVKEKKLAKIKPNNCI